jgi:hypothetical protein
MEAHIQLVQVGVALVRLVLVKVLREQIQRLLALPLP